MDPAGTTNNETRDTEREREYPWKAEEYFCFVMRVTKHLKAAQLDTKQGKISHSASRTAAFRNGFFLHLALTSTAKICSHTKFKKIQTMNTSTTKTTAGTSTTMSSQADAAEVSEYIQMLQPIRDLATNWDVDIASW